MQNPLASDLEHVLDHTRPLWDELRGAHLFITGGTGFFGCWLLESFLWANRQLDLKAHASVLTRRPAAVKQTLPHLMMDPAITLINGDVRNFEYPKGEYSHIIHAATHTYTLSAPPNPLILFNVNVQGTYHVLDFADTCHAKKILFTSSGAVYGKQPPEMTHIPEDYLGAPATTELQAAYGHSKRVSEFLCTAATASGLQAKIARCFAFVGPYLPLNTNYAIGNFIRDVLNHGPILISGDGTPYRSYLYAADLTIWLWTIFFKGQSCHPYNVGSDSDLTIEQLAREVITATTSHSTFKINKQPMPGQRVDRYVPSIDRAKTELGLNTWIPLTEAIRRTANFYK